MLFQILADVLVVLHLAFIVFVVLGGFLVLKWRRAAYFHVPSAVWGALIQFQGWICPLTPLENLFRRAAGEAGYPNGFLQHYLLPVIYPARLTPKTQVILGLLLVTVNIVIYGIVALRHTRGRSPGAEEE